MKENEKTPDEILQAAKLHEEQVLKERGQAAKAQMMTRKEQVYSEREQATELEEQRKSDQAALAGLPQKEAVLRSDIAETTRAKKEIIDKSQLSPS